MEYFTNNPLVNSIFLNTRVEIESFYSELRAVTTEICRTDGVKNGLKELKRVFEEDLKELEKRLTNE